MKFIEDLIKSFSGSTKAKVSDPFLGAFIGSWIVCNWTQLAILLWGDDKVSSRIFAFDDYLRNSELLEFNSILFVPLFLAVVYVFVYPWVSYLLKKIQEPANNRLHNQDVSIQLNNILRQEALNRQNLLADPSKKILRKEHRDLFRAQEDSGRTFRS